MQFQHVAFLDWPCFAQGVRATNKFQKRLWCCKCLSLRDSKTTWSVTLDDKIWQDVAIISNQCQDVLNYVHHVSTGVNSAFCSALEKGHHDILLPCTTKYHQHHQHPTTVIYNQKILNESVAWIAMVRPHVTSCDIMIIHGCMPWFANICHVIKCDAIICYVCPYDWFQLLPRHHRWPFHQRRDKRLRAFRLACFCLFHDQAIIFSRGWYRTVEACRGMQRCRGLSF